MKKIIPLIAIFCLIASSVNAQKALSIQGENVKDGAIYLTFDGKNLEYFPPDKLDSKKNVAESMTFSLKDDNSCNIYLKWINPLKYKLSWKDTTYVDERDKAINDFIDLLVAPPVTSLNKTENAALAEKSAGTGRGNYNPSIDVNDLIFNSTDLTLLYILLRSYNGVINSEFNTVTDSLKKLDSLNSINVLNKVDLIFSDLNVLDDPTKVLATTSAKETEMAHIESLYKEIESLQKFITTTLSDIEIIRDDALYNSYTKSVISSFIDQTTKTISSNKNLTNKLKPVIEVVKTSIDDESLIAATKGFYRIKSIGFEDGKKLQTTLSIVEFEYKKETKEFSKKGEVLKKSLIFQKYDFFTISVSTGLFYSSSKLKGYGVSNNENGEFTVVEDDIAQNSTAPALFLNFNFGIGSRYFAPLAQVGIDPTKKRPFMLIGAGFSIPSARLAFSGGPIWTWNQSLDNLSVGQTINSTTDLEKDVKYKFDIEPKGWYLGIQYNF